MLGLNYIPFALFLTSCLAYPNLSTRDTTPYTLLGCYADNGSPRVLPDHLLGDDNMTPQLCATHCTGFAYFGLEYGRECWCGNSIPQHPASESSCSFPCAGDASQTCGAGKLINVYSAAPISSASKSSTLLHSSTKVTIPPALITTPPVCHGDNCLNELRDRRFSVSASDFCRKYTATINTNPEAIPTYLENCQSSPEYVSSACTCLLYTPSAIISSSPSSSFHSITSAPHSPTSSSFSSFKTGSSSSKTSSTSFKTSSSSSSSSSSKTSSSSTTLASTGTSSAACIPTAFLMQMAESQTELDGTYLDIIGSTHSVDVYTWTNDANSATQFVLIDSGAYSNVLAVNSGPYQGYTMGSNVFQGTTSSIDPWPSVNLNLPVQCTFPDQQYSGTMFCQQLGGTHFYIWTDPLGGYLFLDAISGFPVVACTLVAVPVC